MTLLNIFPLSIYQSKVSLSKKEKDQLINHILGNKNNQNYKKYKENTFSWTGDQEGYSDLHNSPLFEKLFNEIAKNIYNYLDLLFIDYSQLDLYFQRSWATISKEKEFIGKHNHAQSHLSFAYYLKKEDDDSKIIFWDKNKANEFIPELFDSPTIKSRNLIKKKTLNNSSQVNIIPKEDDIIIFPSKTFHSTERNKMNNNRISISADISFFAKDEKYLEHLTPPLSIWKKF
tara:strand:- start:149 stop:841 length:693 start_codon:yes stop_codon:yes gene_type:complete